MYVTVALKNKKVDLGDKIIFEIMKTGMYTVPQSIVKLTTLRFESKRCVVNLQCSALIEMCGVVVKWTEFCYVGYIRHSCINVRPILPSTVCTLHTVQ